MANETHLAVLKTGVSAWNQWRTANPTVLPNLRQVSLTKVALGSIHLTEADLSGTNFTNAILRHADLSKALLLEADLTGSDLVGANLHNADLSRANLTGANLAGANLSGADLVGANLTGADLSRCNLTDAKLGWANVSSACLVDALLRGATLSRANLSDTELSRADLSEANMIEANLSHAVLREAVLRNAAALRANFQEADLTAANFTEANLSDANLIAASLNDAVFLRADLSGTAFRPPDNSTGATRTLQLGRQDATVATTDFSMSTLSHATLPHVLEEFHPALKNVEDVSKSARGRFFLLLCFCGLVFLTLAAASDVQLILDTLHLKLPIFALEVSLWFFCGSVAFFGLLGFISLHFSLTQLWELLTDLPTYFPDGLPLRRKLYPWTLTLLVDRWQQEQHPFRKTAAAPFDRFRRGIAIFLGWGLVPLTLATVMYRTLVRQDATLSTFLLLFLVSTIFLAIFFYQHAQATILRTQVTHPWRLPSYWAVATFVFGLGIIGQGVKGHLPFTTPQLKMRGMQLEGHVFGAINLNAADFSFARLTGADFYETQLHNAKLHAADLTGVHMQDVTLSDADLREATLTKARLFSVDLTGTNLTQANLIDADLTASDLQSARLVRAQMRGVTLKETLFRNADLTGADLTGAVLFHASLRAANLTGAILRSADLRKAILHEANLQNANLAGADLRQAILDKADLSGANLRGANLAGLVLTDVNLRRADLSEANLSGAILRRVQLDGATLYQTQLHNINLDTTVSLTGTPLETTAIASPVHIPELDQIVTPPIGKRQLPNEAKSEQSHPERQP